MKRISSRAYKKVKKFCASIPKYLQLQLFLTFISWPILLAWGLPLSYASIVGNILFTPFLTIFLLLSSLIFFCELLYIPDMLLILALDRLTIIWTALLTISNRSWLVTFPLPSPSILPLLPLGALALLHYKKYTSPLISSAALLIFFVISSIGLKLTTNNEATVSIPCFNKQLTLIQKRTDAVLIDPGVLGRRISPSWVSYTLIPELNRNGITTIKVICTKPSVTTFRALTTLIDEYNVSEIYMPYWRGKLTNRGWGAWHCLLAGALTTGTKISFITQQACILKKQAITIGCSSKMISKNSMRYKPVTIVNQ